MGFAAGVSLDTPRMTMERFATVVSGQIGQPVNDATGLTGAYPLKVHYTLQGVRTGGSFGATPGDNRDAAPSIEPTIFDALPEQLGLKLVSKKGPVDTLAIEHIDKVPTEN